MLQQPIGQLALRQGRRFDTQALEILTVLALSSHQMSCVLTWRAILRSDRHLSPTTPAQDY